MGARLLSVAFFAGICVLLLGVPNGHAAASGRISFSGAVVEPTCAVDALRLTAVVDGPSVPAQRLACGRTATDAGRAYSRVVVHQAPADLAHDRLLVYFASYAHSGRDGEATVKVVVNTYE